MSRVKNKKFEYPNCPECGKGDNVIKHDSQNGKQRFYCKTCKRTFYATETKKYKRSTNRVLTLLLNLLENNFFNKDTLEEALEETDKSKELACKVLFDNHYADKENHLKFNMTIGCYQPKLLICHDGKDIMFIQIPPYDKNNCIRSFEDISLSKADRKIKVEFTILDNENIGEANKSNHKPKKYK